MIFPLVGNKPSTIKPDDLVRTPGGRTCVCLSLNRDGSRALLDIINGDRFDMLPRMLTLVIAAPIRRWSSYEVI